MREHDSDCATNNAPAEPAGPCDCSQSIQVDFVFAPTQNGPVMQFVEVEMAGKSIRFGKWITRNDGLYALRITGADLEALEDQARGK